MKTSEALIQVFFNRPGKTIPVEKIISDIDNASERIILASAWFTDTEIAEAIARSKVDNVITMFSRADVHRASTKAFEIAQAQSNNSNRPTYLLGSDNFKEGIMHHKFIVIDNCIIWAGSYNFTFQARNNFETLLRIEDRELAMKFFDEVMQISQYDDVIPGYHLLRCVDCRKISKQDEIKEWDSHGGGFCPKCNEYNGEWYRVSEETETEGDPEF